MWLAWTAQPGSPGGPDVPVCLSCLKVITRLHKSGFRFTAELSRRCRDAPGPLHREGAFVTTDAPTPPCHPSAPRIHGLGRPPRGAGRSAVRARVQRCGPTVGQSGPSALGALCWALAPGLAALVSRRLGSCASREGPRGSHAACGLLRRASLPTGVLLRLLRVFSGLDVCCGF